ncbi:MAG: hypothetical protein JO172_12565 [Hyphomicrobiales bacterium]|nr:hypothetical protein [Hyphomicrobiales bacterium]
MSRKLRRLKLHRLSAEDAVPDLRDVSAFNLQWDFLTRLRDAGRGSAAQWLERQRTNELDSANGVEPTQVLSSV